METLIPALGLGLGGYVVYLSLIRIMGTSTNIAHDKVQTTTHFYADDKILTDMPLDTVKIQKVAANLYNINNGSGSYLQVTAPELQEFLLNNKCQIQIVKT
jgi:hypothetical protein